MTGVIHHFASPFHFVDNGVDMPDAPPVPSGILTSAGDDRVTWLARGRGNSTAKAQRAGENRRATWCAAVETRSGSRRVLGATSAAVSPGREPLPSRPPGPRAARGPAAIPAREPLPTSALDLPALPPLFEDTVRTALAELDLQLDATQFAAIDRFVRLLLRWTQAINLTAIREPEAVARDHIVDSLSAVPLLRDLGAAAVLDLGSGGGLPGLPLAIAMPSLRLLLVESVGKKASFLRTAVAAEPTLHGRIEVVAERAEALAMPGRERGRLGVVTVRAVGALAELIELAFPLLAVGGSLVAWKRDPVDLELAAGRNAARALGGEVTVHDVPVAALAGRRLIRVQKTRPTPPRFPRSPAERRSRPL